MTSSNVLNVLPQMSSSNMEMQDEKAAVPKIGNSFEKTLQNAASVGQPEVMTKDLPKAESRNATDSFGAKTNISNDSSKAKIKDTVNQKEEKLSDVASKVDEVASKVKDVIEEELDVSTEDIEKAMETLGLANIDLLNPQCLAELVSTLTGEEDSIALVFSDEFKTILDSVNELSNQLFSEIGIDPIEVKQFIVSLDEQTMAEDIPDFEAKDISNELESKVQIDLNPEKPVETTNDNITFIKQEANEVKQEIDSSINESEDISIELKPLNESQNKDLPNQSMDSNNSKDDFNPFEKANLKESTPIIREDAIAFAEPKFNLDYSFDEPIVSLPTGQTVRAEEIANQLIEQARVFDSSESTTMEMTLNPEGLGKLFVEVSQKGDEVTAKIFTENDAVKQALESQMANLRIELNNSSTKVTSIEVSVGAHEFERNLDENTHDDNRRDEQANQMPRRRSRIDINSLDDLGGLMSEEEMLIAQIMKDNGNSLDFQA